MLGNEFFGILLIHSQLSRQLWTRACAHDDNVRGVAVRGIVQISRYDQHASQRALISAISARQAAAIHIAHDDLSSTVLLILVFFFAHAASMDDLPQENAYTNSAAHIHMTSKWIESAL